MRIFIRLIELAGDRTHFLLDSLFDAVEDRAFVVSAPELTVSTARRGIHQ